MSEQNILYTGIKSIVSGKNNVIEKLNNFSQDGIIWMKA